MKYQIKRTRISTQNMQKTTVMMHEFESNNEVSAILTFRRFVNDNDGCYYFNDINDPNTIITDCDGNQLDNTDRYVFKSLSGNTIWELEEVNI